MAFPPEVAAALSGASVRQLSYCRLAKSDEPLLAPEFHEPRSRVSYSFRDVVALRAFVFLRSRRVSLQHVRKAVKSLRSLGEAEHLSRYRLVAVGKDVVWRVSDEEAVALTGAPGQLVIAEMVDILAAFTNMWGRNVVPLCEPTPGVRVDPDIRGGYPVVAGTRVPYDLVASLLDDGVAPDDVSAFYPSVGSDGARGAVAFARYVDEYREHPKAA